MIKKYLIFPMFALTLFACNTSEENDVAIESENELNTKVDEITFASFGEVFEMENETIVDADELLAKYNSLGVADTLEDIVFLGQIENVCQKKGCWMNVNIGNDNETFVRFKDYGFFMPLNAAGSKAVVKGRAFVSEISVEELQHYAEDEGKSPEEIAEITEPEFSFAFLASGVLIEE